MATAQIQLTEEREVIQSAHTPQHQGRRYMCMWVALVTQAEHLVDIMAVAAVPHITVVVVPHILLPAADFFLHCHLIKAMC